MPSSQSFRDRLLSASLLLGGAVLLRILLVLLRNKLLAIWLGPAGLGVLSQINGISDIVALACTGGFGVALARFTAGSSKSDREGVPGEQQPGNGQALTPLTASMAARTAFRFMAVACLVTAIAVWALSASLAHWFIGNAAYASLMAVVAFIVPANAYYQYSLGLLQGAGRVRSQVVQSASYSVLWLVCAVILVWFFGLPGGAWSMVAAWFGVAFASWWLLRSAHLHSLAFQDGALWKKQPGDATALAAMARYGGIALVSALSIPMTAVGLRAVLIHYNGEVAGGFYQVPVAASNLTYAVLTTALSGFVLPHVYRHIHNRQQLHAELETTLRLILAFMTPVVVVLLLFRHTFAHLLFSAKFQMAASMIAPQLCADWLHVIVWWLALPLLPAGLYAVSFCCEAAAFFLTVGLAWLLVPRYGLAGATLAAAMAQGAVLLSLWAFRARHDHLRLRQTTWLALVGCGALIFATAWLSR